MRKEMVDAVRTLQALTLGQAVDVVLEGRAHRMTVSRTARRSDGAYGSYESTNVTVTLGVGGYSTEVWARLLVTGQQSIVVVS